MKSDDLLGKQYNRLFVLKKDSSKPVKWLCQCNCGNTVVVRTAALNNGHTRSCGCLNKDISKNKQVKKFGTTSGYWRILGKGSKPKTFLCQCICGTVKDVASSSLSSKASSNCGCLANKATSIRSVKDLSGKQFGALTVLSREESFIKRPRWNCQCKCGNICIVRGNHLKNGNQISCGKCRWKNEELCRQIIERLTHHLFPKVRPSFLLNISGYPLELDGYCEQLKLAFEYDGEQHFRQVDYFELTENIQKRDKLKSQLCQENGITLIRIPFTQKRKLEEFIKQQLTLYLKMDVE